MSSTPLTDALYETSASEESEQCSYSEYRYDQMTMLCQNLERHARAMAEELEASKDDKIRREVITAFRAFEKENT